jgi:hypothetical protein
MTARMAWRSFARVIHPAIDARAECTMAVIFAGSTVAGVAAFAFSAVAGALVLHWPSLSAAVRCCWPAASPPTW